MQKNGNNRSGDTYTPDFWARPGGLPSAYDERFGSNPFLEQGIALTRTIF